MMMRDVRQFVIKSQNIMKEGESDLSDSEMDGWILDGNTTENCWEFLKVLNRVQNGMRLRNTGNIIK